jgi:hypothetical protein
LKNNLFFTLERPWLNNQRSVSCIPEGSYEVTPFNSLKHPKTFHVQNVPQRGGILIHSGNVIEHSKGCILIGLKWGFVSGKRAVLNSRSALAGLNNLIEKFILNIKGVNL